MKNFNHVYARTTHSEETEYVENQWKSGKPRSRRCTEKIAVKAKNVAKGISI